MISGGTAEVENVNDAPTITGDPVTTVVVGTPYSFTPGGDIDGDTLTYEVSNKPGWTVFDPATGSLNGTPTIADVRISNNISIGVGDGKGGSAILPNFRITVVHQALALTAPSDQTYAVGTAITDLILPEATGGGTLTYALTGAPAGLTFDAGTRTLSGTPTTVAATTTLTYMVMREEGGATKTQDFTVTVSVGTLALTDPDDQAYAVGTAITDLILPEATGGGTLTYALTGPSGGALPDGLTFDEDTRTLSGTPTTVAATTTLTYTVTRSEDSTSETQDFTVTVTHQALVLAAPANQSYSVGTAIADLILPEATGGGTVIYTLTGALPAGLTFDAATRTLSGTPTTAAATELTYMVMRSEDNAVVEQDFTVTVSTASNTPVTGVVTISGSAIEDAILTAETSAIRDADGLGTFTYQWHAGGADIEDATSPTLTLTQAQVGAIISVTVSFEDNGGTTEMLTGALTDMVKNVNDAPTGLPTITGDAIQNETLTADVSGISDPDGLGTFTYQWFAGGADISGATDPTFTLTQAQVGAVIIVTVSYQDGGGMTETLSSRGTRAIANGAVHNNSLLKNSRGTRAIANVDDVPTITGTPTTTVNEDSEYSFTPTGEDVDGDRLTYSITGAPAWADFDSTTGALTGVPENTHVGTTSGIVITITAGGMRASLDPFDIEVVNTNDAPSLVAPTPVTTVAQGTPYSYTAIGSDVDGDTLIYSIVNRPTWAEFDTSTGALTGTPGSGDVGTTSNIRIRVTDSIIETPVSIPGFDITVTHQALALTAPSDQSYTVGAAITDLVLQAATGGGTLTYALTGPSGGALPAGLTFDAGTRTLSGTPTAAAATELTYMVMRSEDNASDTQDFTVTVSDAANNPATGTPAITGIASQGQTLTAGTDDIADADADGPTTLTFTYQWQGDGADITGATERTFTLTQDQVGETITVTVSYTDGGGTGESVTSAATGAVTNTNDAPTGLPSITGTATQGNLLTAVTTGIMDDDGPTTLTFTYQWQGDGADITGATERTFVLTNAQVNLPITVTVSFTDGQGTVEDLTSAATLRVVNVNDAPTITGTPDATAVVGVAYSFTPKGTDVDGDRLTYSIVNEPSWATFSTSTGALTGTPDASNVGDFSGIVITVNDGGLMASLDPFDIEVFNTNAAPTIIGTPATTVDEDSEYSFTPTGADADGDALTYSIVNEPSWATFSATTGALTGTPGNDHVGTTSGIVITITAGGMSASLTPFDIVVVNTNDVPTISGTPVATANEDEFYEFIPGGGDIDADDTAVYSIESAPSWATFNTATGALTGAPENAHVGTTSGIVITITAGGMSASLTPFDIEVVNTNDVPVISGPPITGASVGTFYTFTPTVVDVDVPEDTLTYSIANTPSWATFSTSTGALTGTPGTDDVGISDIIVIGISDGTVNATLTGFQITVTHQALALTAPSDQSYTAGTAITDLILQAATGGGTLTYALTGPSGGALPAGLTFDANTRTLSGTPTTVAATELIYTVTRTEGGASYAQGFTVTVSNAANNLATGTPLITGTVEQNQVLTVDTDDIDDADGPTTLTFTYQWKANGADISGATDPTFTLAQAQVDQTITVTVSFTDTLNNPESRTSAATIAVVDVNDIPTLTVMATTSATQDRPYTQTLNGDDVDGDTLTYTITSTSVALPAWLTLNSATGVLTGTPTNEDIGQVIFTVQVSDGDFVVSRTGTINVGNVNDAPTITGTPGATAVVGVAYSFTPGGGDVDIGDTLTYSLSSSSPSWLTINSTNGILTGTPTITDVGTSASIIITVTDSRADASLEPFTITVTALVNTPATGEPVITGTVTENQTLTADISGIADADGLTRATYTYEWRVDHAFIGGVRVENAPIPGATERTLVLVDAQVDRNITVNVSFVDDRGNSESLTSAPTAEVDNVNTAPTGTVSILGTVRQDETLTATGTDTIGDGDGQSPGFNYQWQADDEDIEDATDKTFVLTEAHVGAVITVKVIFTDGHGTDETLTSAGTAPVENVNDAPTISGNPPTTIAVGERYIFSPGGGDIDVGDTLTYSIPGKPGWLTLFTGSGVLGGRPTNDDVGVIGPIVLTVTDDGTPALSASLDPFTITVTPGNAAPTITGTPDTTVAEGASYSFTPTGADVDGDALTYTIVNTPTWAEFVTTTGALTGTPGNDDIGGDFSGIVITVNDGEGGTASLPAFTITVAPGNAAPTITAIPDVTAVEDAPFSHQVVATDDESDTLTYSVSGPTWLTINSGTGVLAGTPTNADVTDGTNVTVTVSDGTVRDTPTSDQFTLTVTNTNDAPTLGGSPVTRINEDDAYRFNALGEDIDVGDSLTYGITNNPGWLTVNSVGVVSGTPLNEHVATTMGVSITLTDAEGEVATLGPFNIIVDNTNDAPTLSGTPSATVVAGNAYSFTPTVMDVDVGDTTWTYSLSGPTWLSIDSVTGIVSGTPDTTDVGDTVSITITATDAGGAAGSLAPFIITVTDASNNVATGLPVVSGNATQNQTLTADTSGIADADGPTMLSFSYQWHASGTDISGATSVTFVLTQAQVGKNMSVTVSFTDDLGNAESLTSMSVDPVADVNDRPVFTSGTPPNTVAQDAPYSYIAVVSDADNDPLTFMLSGDDTPWLRVNPDTGELSGTPTSADVGGPFGLSLAVDDKRGGIRSLRFNVTVTNVNDAPTITGTPVTTVDEDSPYTFTALGVDADGDTLTYSLSSNAPSWLSIDSMGVVSGTPLNADVGTATGIVITVTDDGTPELSASLSAFNIVVVNVNDAPTITGRPDTTTVAIGATYTFTPGGGDVDVGDTLTYSIENPPTWATFNTRTGALTGTPEASDAGQSTTFVISVSDGTLDAALRQFSIMVLKVDTPPTITGTPDTTVDEDSEYSFTPTGADVDGDTLAYSIENRPIWADFDSVTGALTGVPTNDHVGTTTGIVITVTANEVSVSLDPFDIVVVNTDDAPTISGNPATTVDEDSLYSFTPMGADADGDRLSYTVTPRPIWSDFNTSTGTLSGTPLNDEL